MMFLKDSDSPTSTQSKTYPTIDDNYNVLSKETNEKEKKEKYKLQKSWRIIFFLKRNLLILENEK